LESEESQGGAIRTDRAAISLLGSVHIARGWMQRDQCSPIHG